MPHKTGRSLARRGSRLPVGVAVLTVAAAFGAGCNAMFGVDDLSYEGASSTSASSGGGGSTSSSSSTGQGGGSDPCTYDVGGCRCFRDDGGCPGLPSLAGWNTSVQVYTGSQENAPDCAETLVEGTTINDPNAVQCPTCDCGTPDASCQVDTTFYDSNNCYAGVTLSLAFDDETCTPISNATTWQAAGLSFAASGTCAPSGTPTFPAGAFASVCAAPVSCEGACLPIADSGFDPRFCILRSGEEECPEGFGSAYDVYPSDDFCSDCNCAAAVGVGCRLLLYFNDAVCDGSHTMESGNDNCSSVGAPPPLSGQAEITDSGSCQPSGGGATVGEPKISHTFCCLEGP